MTSKPKNAQKLTRGIAAVILLAVCLCITSLALIFAGVSVENNIFRTGNVSLNLNDGKPVIQEHEFLFEPGMTVRKTLFVRNESSCEVFYRLYFENVSGGLADVLEISIYYGEKLLYSGTAAGLTKSCCAAADDVLRLREYRELSVEFHFPEDAGNPVQNATLNFDLCAQAVQTKNNPGKQFD